MSRLSTYPGMFSSKTPYQQNQFQRSLDRQRMRESRKAATFAASAPMPEVSAFGDSYRGSQQGQAARKAFIEDQTIAAEDAASNLGKGDNYFQGRELAADYNTRENAGSAAQNSYMGSAGRLNDARANQTSYLTPYIGKGMEAHAGYETSEAGVNNARAAQIPQMTAPLIKRMDAESEAIARPPTEFNPKYAEEYYGKGMDAAVRQSASYPGMQQKATQSRIAELTQQRQILESRAKGQWDRAAGKYVQTDPNAAKQIEDINTEIARLQGFPSPQKARGTATQPSASREY